ncbi:hypothetical protein [Streptomyces lavendofoliae]|uniref:Uncharacterized protein n=1 Tax=Streptomyces lavendofoliae TaxID=67314 RepID=A0A918I2I7_9ACTN|nr:hypothetical protein [Streptomyces lavendofoliae]GGU62040.1 hypothetical protein GCM10010274_58510 [Streptomyces lavendofoliae]
MSAAEPTIPEPAHGPIGSVIHLAQHPSAARSRVAARRTDPPSTGYDVSPLQKLTETIQSIFRARGMTLADAATADAYEATLDVVELMMRSATARGHVAAEQYETLRQMLDEMRAVPEAV